jgi:hypothetical protein
MIAFVPVRWRSISRLTCGYARRRTWGYEREHRQLQPQLQPGAEPRAVIARRESPIQSSSQSLTHPLPCFLRGRIRTSCTATSCLSAVGDTFAGVRVRTSAQVDRHKERPRTVAPPVIGLNGGRNGGQRAVARQRGATTLPRCPAPIVTTSRRRNPGKNGQRLTARSTRTPRTARAAGGGPQTSTAGNFRRSGDSPVDDEQSRTGVDLDVWLPQWHRHEAA